jgi:hypothetical protein
MRYRTLSRRSAGIRTPFRRVGLGAPLALGLATAALQEGAVFDLLTYRLLAAW